MIRNIPKVASTEEGTYQTERVEALMKYAGATTMLGNLKQAMVEIAKRNGSWQVRWGDINRYQRSVDGKYDDNQPSMPAASVASTYGQLPSFVSRPGNGQKLLYGYSEIVS